MATSNNVLISVQHLVKEYNHGTVHALNDCNLEIKKGEVVAIIGPSGPATEQSEAAAKQADLYL